MNKRIDNWVVILFDFVECFKIINVECFVVCVWYDFVNDDRNKLRLVSIYLFFLICI